MRNSHPAIVSAEVFELVQMEMERRRQFGSRYSGRGVFASRIVCADCGGFFGSKVWHSNDPYRTVVWRCNQKYEKKLPKERRCSTPHATEDAIKKGFVRVMQKLLANKTEVLAACEETLNGVLSTEEIERQAAKLQDQAVGLAQRIRSLVNENARTSMNQGEFQREYDKLVGQYEKLISKIETLQHDKTDKESRAKKASLFIGLLSEQQECIDFDPALFTVYVERVVVSGTKKDTELTFVLMDGSEYTIEGVR